MEESTKETKPYLNEEIDTLFFNNKGLRTPYKETYEDVFGKPMTTNKSNINLGSYINGISKEEAKTMKPDVYKNGEVISGPSLNKEKKKKSDKNEEEPTDQENSDITMEDFFNKVNEGIVSDKVYKRLNVNVSDDGQLVEGSQESEETPVEKPSNELTMEDLFNKVNKSIDSDKVYKRLNIDVDESNQLVTPEEKVEIDEEFEKETISPVVLVDDSNNAAPKEEVTTVQKTEADNQPITNVKPKVEVRDNNNVNTNMNSNNNINNSNTSINNNNNINNNYEVVKTAYDNAERNNISKLYDEEGAPFAVIVFSYLVFPLGIILYLVNHNKKERYARNCLLAGLFGALTCLILTGIGLLNLRSTL